MKEVKNELMKDDERQEENKSHPTIIYRLNEHKGHLWTDCVSQLQVHIDAHMQANQPILSTVSFRC